MRQRLSGACAECGTTFVFELRGRPQVTCSEPCRRTRKLRQTRVRILRWAERAASGLAADPRATCEPCGVATPPDERAVHLISQEHITNVFWAQVDRTGDCWSWTGTRYGGRAYVTGPWGLDRYAHRAAWQLAHDLDSPLPDQVVRQRCGSAWCVRPEHQVAVARSANTGGRQAASAA